MKRGGPLKADPSTTRAWQDRSRTELDRGKPVKKVNAKRKAKRVADDHTYGSFYRYVCSLPCAVGGEGDECLGDVVGHHLRSVGAGGRDAGNLSPLCVRHHRMIHDMGPKRFDDRFFNDIKLHADIIWRRYCDGLGSA